MQAAREKDLRVLWPVFTFGIIFIKTYLSDYLVLIIRTKEQKFLQIISLFQCLPVLYQNQNHQNQNQDQYYQNQYLHV